ncbi:hypothetical protein [Blastopirellula marina]|uniref:hypothetical protein n=1 Tax=Blastopirellula marina TaxID=124 RepID=UPI0011B05FE2|nr:hypothetical protein [Blastopirellula marina]
MLALDLAQIENTANADYQYAQTLAAGLQNYGDASIQADYGYSVQLAGAIYAANQADAQSEMTLSLGLAAASDLATADTNSAVNEVTRRLAVNDAQHDSNVAAAQLTGVTTIDGLLDSDYTAFLVAKFTGQQSAAANLVAETTDWALDNIAANVAYAALSATAESVYVNLRETTIFAHQLLAAASEKLNEDQIAASYQANGTQLSAAIAAYQTAEAAALRDHRIAVEQADRRLTADGDQTAHDAAVAAADQALADAKSAFTDAYYAAAIGAEGDYQADVAQADAQYVNNVGQSRIRAVNAIADASVDYVTTEAGANRTQQESIAARDEQFAQFGADEEYDSLVNALAALTATNGGTSDPWTSRSLAIATVVHDNAADIAGAICDFQLDYAASAESYEVSSAEANRDRIISETKAMLDREVSNAEATADRFAKEKKSYEENAELGPITNAWNEGVEDASSDETDYSALPVVIPENLMRPTPFFIIVSGEQSIETVQPDIGNQDIVIIGANPTLISDEEMPPRWNLTDEEIAEFEANRKKHVDELKKIPNWIGNSGSNTRSSLDARTTIARQALSRAKDAAATLREIEGNPGSYSKEEFVTALEDAASAYDTYLEAYDQSQIVRKQFLEAQWVISWFDDWALERNAELPVTIDELDLRPTIEQFKAYNKTIRETSSALGAQIETLDFAHGAVKGVAVASAITLTVIFVPGAGAAFAIVGAVQVASAINARRADDQTLTEISIGTAADVSGFNSLHIGLYGKDYATGKVVELTAEQRGELFGSGIIQVASFSIGAADGASRIRFTPPTSAPGLQLAGPSGVPAGSATANGGLAISWATTGGGRLPLNVIAVNGSIVVMNGLKGINDDGNTFMSSDDGVDAPRLFLGADDFAKLPKSGRIDPKSVRFSQDSIAGNFKEGGNVLELGAKLKVGQVDPSSIPPIRIVLKDGKVFTLDNRRLRAFQEAGIDVPFERLDAIPKRELFKFTTKNVGVDIIIREATE